VLRNLLIVYGLGAGWLWWVYAPSPLPVTIVAGALLAVATGLAAHAARRRNRRRRSQWESISPRLITHGGAGLATARWDRRPADRAPDEDFEADLKMGW
jgi:hypothetical protein